MKGWLHTPIEDEANFNEKVKAICQLYYDAPKLHADGVHQLVYYEVHSDVHEAILREKKIKKWRRQWKIYLIERDNPRWCNLAIGLF